jgi:hypothetical protein
MRHTAESEFLAMLNIAECKDVEVERIVVEAVICIWSACMVDPLV